MSDYESDHIDLTDVKVYRDLSLPIGAQNANRRIIIQEKYQTMQELRYRLLHVITQHIIAIAHWLFGGWFV